MCRGRLVVTWTRCCHSDIVEKSTKRKQPCRRRSHEPQTLVPSQASAAGAQTVISGGQRNAPGVPGAAG
ncbi:unnamed protein product [Pleuronectes platessa]|uniref:Uncharacterized protein n=1 Tax=Pleuronectes platessa TaxID=8262 RepID=A0A9N7YLH3_PLEPL|nr:unnamed protein product [Pleuronectes platessa]